MNLRTLSRITLAAILFSAIPFVSVTAVTTIMLPAQEKILTNLHTRGAAEIDRRLAGLRSALAKVDASVKLATADKKALTTQIQAEITGLTALKTKLAADTDVATARTDVAGVAAGYRVYALILPKARLVAATDRQTMAVEKLTELAGRLEATIAAAKADGANVVAAEGSLELMNNQIALVRTSLIDTVPLLIQLQSTDYNTDHETLVAYREKLQASQTNLKNTRDLAKKIIEQLRAQK